MRYGVAIFSFLAISLCVTLIVAALNLSDAKIRRDASEHLRLGDARALTTTLFRADHVEALAAATLWRLGMSIHPDSVIVGKQGWLHLGDRYAKTLSVTRGDGAAELQQRSARVGESLKRWDAWLRSKGVQDTVVMIGPNKSSVYPETLPDWVLAKGLADFLQPMQESAGPILLNLRPVLQEKARNSGQPLYYRTDTHWNSLGAAYAFERLGRRLRQNDPTLSWPLQQPLPFEGSRERQGGDLAVFLRIPRIIMDVEPQLPFAIANRFETTVTNVDTGVALFTRRFPRVDFPSLTVHASTPAALNQRRVLWLRDSFGAALSPWMSATFGDVVQLHWNAGMKDGARLLQKLVSDWQPHLVVFTVVERDSLSGLLLQEGPLQR